MDRPRNVMSSIGCYRAIRYLLAVLVISIPFGMAWATHPDSAVRVEVLTATDHEVVSQREIRINERVESIDLQIYQLNGIQLVEVELSKDLTADPDQSKRLALQRIQVLDTETRARMQRSAIGLVKAMQYGIDRYPAIIFDGQAVVYGVTDVQAALAHYQAWQVGDKP